MKSMPIVDDTDNKIRRNLLAVSSLILAISFLSLSESEILKKIFYGSLDIELWKFLLIEFLTLFYFAFRFRFSSFFDDAWRYKNAEFDQLRQDALRRYIKVLINNYAEIRSNSSVFLPPLSSMYQKYLDHNRSELPSKFELRDMSYEYIDPANEWSGKVWVKISIAKNKDDNFPVTEKLSTSYFMGVFERVHVYSETYVKYFLYSKSSITLFVPLTLFIAAASTLLCRSLIFFR